jgi:trehalose 6-phosphate phosphatase
VKLTELYYAGSHGMDIMVPEIRSTYKQVNTILTFTFVHMLLPIIFITFENWILMMQGDNLFQPAREFLPMMDEVFSIRILMSIYVLLYFIIEGHYYF